MNYLSMIALLLFFACSEDPQPVTVDRAPVSTTITSDAVTISSAFATQNDPVAKKAFQNADKLRLKLQEYSILLNIPEDTTFDVINGLNTWSWVDQGYDYQYQLEADGERYHFIYTIGQQGTILSTITGWESRGDSAAYLHYYLAIFGNEVITIEASRGANAIYVIDYRFGTSDSPTPFNRQIGTYYNGDGSGGYKQYSYGEIRYEANWNADGSGSSVTYSFIDSTTDDTYTWR